MMDFDFSQAQGIKRMTLEATVIRKDGTRIPLGIVAASDRDPLGFQRMCRAVRRQLGRISFRGA